MTIEIDIAAAVRVIRAFPTRWEGRPCVLEMKEADFNWRQMEWWAFYWDLLFRKAAPSEFRIPGDRFGSVRFDMRGSINWDLKAKAIKSDSHDAILNDTAAVDQAIAQDGHYGAVVALCDVDYNDESRSFQRWRERLQGGKSAYQRDRERRTQVSRYRKTRAEPREVLFLTLDARTVRFCATMRQGRNSSGKPRPPKYIVDLEACGPLIRERLRL